MNSPFGRVAPDSDGSAVGLARMDPQQSYSGIGGLLQAYINNADQTAWKRITEKIGHTFECLDFALEALNRETDFHLEIKSRVGKGQKLLFKPNIVNPVCINPHSHDAGPGSTACTEWAFVAALMRWFHEKLSISYHQMALGEASTMTSAIAAMFTMMNPDSPPITPEAVIEGKSGDFYGGWGFFFARKYLAESAAHDAEDDPMHGFEESISGTYRAPGLAPDKLMVYDLNRISDDATKGRSIQVSDGVNYKSITLHKAIVGGDKENPQDAKENPGCILINVPKFKVHAVSLFTNVIKNLGIGLYPMLFSSSGGCSWDYSAPHKPLCGMKAGLPHEVWVPVIDCETGVTQRDAKGNYVTAKTGGLTATMIDVIKAVKEQDIFMMHIVDGVEAINKDHQGLGLGEKVGEGMVFASLDPVAVDLFCARYMFGNVPLKDAIEAGIEDGNGGYFPQAVPIPRLEGKNIISSSGFDCPISREVLFEEAERRGLGVRKYYGVGFDSVAQKQLFTVKGHLGTEDGGEFTDLITGTMYYDMFKFPWDMQKSTFSYLEASDALAGTSIKKELLDAFDDDGDEILTYKCFGKKGIWGTLLNLGADMVCKMGAERYGYLKDRYSFYATMLKNSDALFNEDKHDLLKEYLYAGACTAAFQISQLGMEFPDFFQPGLVCGKGKWPSFRLAQFFHRGVMLFGQGFPYMIGFPSMYSAALVYADLTQNGGQYAGRIWSQPSATAINQYVEKARSGEIKPLQFTLYAPVGYDTLFGKKIPNVQVVNDPAKVFTTEFANGEEVWPETRGQI